MIFEGSVWKVRDNVSATDLVPGRYDEEGMSGQWEECAKHVLEDMHPAMASQVQPGDILVAGAQFGAGHAHYYMTAIKGVATAGIGAMLAESVGALFLRAAVDAGQPTWSIPGIASFVTEGDRLRIDLAAGSAANLTVGTELAFSPVSPIVLDILRAGGSSRWAQARAGVTHG